NRRARGVGGHHRVLARAPHATAVRALFDDYPMVTEALAELAER
ncbi:MAG: hypothetical protein QOF99_2333, partial [Pseudonocardiales bacterium]|nr:hypothetical protein [Pseudonocardiales bacterium]